MENAVMSKTWILVADSDDARLPHPIDGMHAIQTAEAMT